MTLLVPHNGGSMKAGWGYACPNCGRQDGLRYLSDPAESITCLVECELTVSDEWTPPPDSY